MTCASCLFFFFRHARIFGLFRINAQTRRARGSSSLGATGDLELADGDVAAFQERAREVGAGIASAGGASAPKTEGAPLLPCGSGGANTGFADPKLPPSLRHAGPNERLGAAAATADGGGISAGDSPFAAILLICVTVMQLFW